MILWRNRVQFSILIALPKIFSPSTVNVRSKFWRVWKKRDFPEVWFFDRSYETKTAIFNFNIPAKIFSPSTVNVRSKFWRNWKKKENFQKFGFLSDLLRRRLQFSILISLPKLFSPSTVNVHSKTWRVWKK